MTPRARLSATDPPGRRATAALSVREGALLDRPLSALGVDWRGTALETRLGRLHTELARRGLLLRPYLWLSTDFFTPDGATGFAVPFYLADRRLVRLEREQMHEVEGSGHTECMQLLRHEAAHAFDNAFRLRRRRRFREIFGPAGTPYRESYRPDPKSRAYVQHLPRWYAQSHPVEDFAETFSVWLAPRARWRETYRGWPALEKLDALDEWMGELAGTVPPVRTRKREGTLAYERDTLREHYRKKRARYQVGQPTDADDWLRSVFPGDGRGRSSAASFLLRRGRDLARRVARAVDTSPYCVEQVLAELVPRCRALDLRLASSPEDALLDAAVHLTAAVSKLQAGRRPTFVR